MALKKILILTFFYLSSSWASAQNTSLSYRLKILSADENYANKQVSVLIHFKKGSNALEHIARNGGRIKFIAGDICSAVLPASSLEKMAGTEGILRMEEGHVAVKELNDKMRLLNRIDPVHQGVSPLTQGYDGEGVVMGIIDTGIDFTHPDFKDSLGLSRVLWIWDHLLPNSGNTPQPYNYGQEFSKADIDAGNAGAHIDQTAHGTHVAGIAAASGDTLPDFKGAAPKSSIIAVSLDFNIDDESWLSSIADAVAYIFNKADSMGMPCVINISAGTYYGSHDGLDLQTQAIDNLITAQNGRMVVAAAGNAGGYPIHLSHNPSNDTAFTWLQSTGGSPMYIELWADTSQISQTKFNISSDIINPYFEISGSLPWRNINAHLNILRSDTLFGSSGNRLAVVQSYGQRVGTRYNLIFYITPDSSTYNYRFSSAGNGSFDAWSFDMVYNNLPSPGIFPPIIKYISPDLTQNICSSFQCSEKVICVGQYVSRNNYIDYNGNIQTFNTTEGALGASSSRGPTRDGRIKPDITATGEITLAALKLSAAPWFIANQPYKLAQGGLHIRDGGTSSAAPAVAGAIALYLQMNPAADWVDIRQRVMLCSNLDSFTTGNIPNNNWGHGKLDAFNMITGCNALGIQETAGFQALIFPNPANDHISIRLDSKEKISELKIMNSTGQVTHRMQNPKETELLISTTGIPQGYYRLIIHMSSGKTFNAAFVIQH